MEMLNTGSKLNKLLFLSWIWIWTTYTFSSYVKIWLKKLLLLTRLDGPFSEYYFFLVGPVVVEKTWSWLSSDYGAFMPVSDSRITCHHVNARSIISIVAKTVVLRRVWGIRREGVDEKEKERWPIRNTIIWIGLNCPSSISTRTRRRTSSSSALWPSWSTTPGMPRPSDSTSTPSTTPTCEEATCSAFSVRTRCQMAEIDKSFTRRFFLCL